MLTRLVRTMASAAPLWRWAALLLLALPLCSHAATYTFRSDSFSWETAANAITWDKTCTGYPGDDDKATITFTGGFKFPFAGTQYTSVRVLTNGILQFSADTGLFRTYTNTTLPAAATPSATTTTGATCVGGATTRVIIPYWTDLDPSRAGAGNVTWEQKGTAPNRRLVVSWNSVWQYNTTTPYAFQVILYENGEFKYQYGNANTTGSKATIGVQVSDTDYTLYSFNSGYNANGAAIRWFQPSGSPTRLAEYRMDEYYYDGTIGEVSDSSGNGYGGVRVGNAVSDPSGYVCRGIDIPANTTAAEINAVDTTVDIDSALGQNGGISFWYRSDAAWVGGAAAQLLDASGSATRPFFLTRTSSGALRFVLSDSAGTLLDATSSVRNIAAGTWTHVAVSWRVASGTGQSNVRIYANGTLVGATSGTTNGRLDTSLLTLFLGDNRSATLPANASPNSADGRFDEVRVYNYEITALEIGLDMAVTHTCVPPVDHMELRHASGSGLTCTPNAITIVACQNAACTARYTGGLTGTLTASGTPSVVFTDGSSAFSIPAGSSSIDESVQVTTPGSVVFGLTSLSQTPTASTSCNFGSPACTFTAADAGLQFDVPDHVSDTSQSVTVKAVRKADNSLACTPAFASVSKPITFSCGYLNPATGTRTVGVGAASVACGGSGQAVTLAFDATGTATTSVRYADVGQMSLAARYAGSGTDAGLVLTGNDNFIAAPDSFAVAGPAATTIQAGTPFSATVTARNASGAATPNFGRETSFVAPTVTFTRRQPAGLGASDGVFTAGTLGAFTSGVATMSGMSWSEVGRGDLTASLTGYLGTAFNVQGSTGTGAPGAVGEFIPHHFDIELDTTSGGLPAHGCPVGGFTYAAQPFGVVVRAENLAGATTVNYSGGVLPAPAFARAVTLTSSNLGALGSFGSTGTVPASAFSVGIARVSTPAFTYTAKQTYSSAALALRATEAAGGNGVTSNGFVEGSTPLRSGRLVVANGYGSEKSALRLAARAEYWSGAAWVPSTADSCTTVPSSAVALSRYLDHRGAAATWTTTPSALTLTAGVGELTLSAPTGGATGSVDLAINLGTSATDESCNASHPATTGAGLPWLRSRQGNCAAGWAADPSARASFGVYSPETRKTVHVREIF